MISIECKQAILLKIHFSLWSEWMEWLDEYLINGCWRVSSHRSRAAPYVEWCVPAIPREWLWRSERRREAQTDSSCECCCQNFLGKSVNKSQIFYMQRKMTDTTLKKNNSCLSNWAVLHCHSSCPSSCQVVGQNVRHVISLYWVRLQSLFYSFYESSGFTSCSQNSH